MSSPQQSSPQQSSSPSISEHQPSRIERTSPTTLVPVPIPTPGTTEHNNNNSPVRKSRFVEHLPETPRFQTIQQPPQEATIEPPSHDVAGTTTAMSSHHRYLVHISQPQPQPQQQPCLVETMEAAARDDTWQVAPTTLETFNIGPASPGRAYYEAPMGSEPWTAARVAIESVTGGHDTHLRGEEEEEEEEGLVDVAVPGNRGRRRRAAREWARRSWDKVVPKLKKTGVAKRETRDDTGERGDFSSGSSNDSDDKSGPGSVIIINSNSGNDAHDSGEGSPMLKDNSHENKYEIAPSTTSQAKWELPRLEEASYLEDLPFHDAWWAPATEEEIWRARLDWEMRRCSPCPRSDAGWPPMRRGIASASNSHGFGE